jgi:hypothetical protein
MRHTAVKSLRIVTLGFGTGRQKRALQRWTNPKPQRRTRSPRYGLPSCRGKSAGVAKRPRERSPTRTPYRYDSQLLHRCMRCGITDEVPHVRVLAVRVCIEGQQRERNVYARLSPSRGGLPGLAGVRIPQRCGTTSCREAAPLPHQVSSTPLVSGLNLTPRLGGCYPRVQWCLHGRLAGRTHACPVWRCVCGCSAAFSLT